MNDAFVKGNTRDSLGSYAKALAGAEELYAEISRAGFSLDTKSGPDHLDPLTETLRLFARAAEIKFPA